MIDHLYIHVPFCKTICSYCDFCHTVYNVEKVNKWLDRLTYDFSKLESYSFSTIYIGGGTPSCLDFDNLKRLLDLVKPYSNNVIEYTIELNPETVDEEKIELIKTYGVNRVSIGLQSTSEKLLKLMNRHHSFDDVKNTISLLRKHGIDNISIDIMYSLPGQTMDDLMDTLNAVLILNVPHISLYSLTIEKDTIFDKLGYKPLDSELEADMYEYIDETLVRNGYVHYEIANFAKNCKESKHNLGYWNYDDYIGLGCGAIGKYKSKRFVETKDINKYINEKDTVQIEDISNSDLAFENIMMSLRTNRGLDLSVFKERYGYDFNLKYKEAIEKNSKYLLIKDNRCICTNIEILNKILIDFMD